MKATPEKIFRLKTLATIMLVLIPLSRLSWVMFWSDSEMWAATVARGLFTEWKSYAFELKPLLYLPLYLSFQIAKLFDLWPMQTARSLFFLIAALIVILTLRLARRPFEPYAQLPFVMVFTLGSSALFLERIYNVRSDLLASALVLTSLYLLHRQQIGARTPRQLILALAPATAALFVSLNSIFLFPFLFANLNSQNFSYKLKNKHLSLIAAGAAISIVALLFLTRSFQLSYDFFIQSFDTASSGVAYFDPKRFEHVVRWIAKDPHIFALFVFKIIYDLIGFIMKKSSANRFSFFGYWALLLILLHPNRLPFFLVSLLPFLLLWAFELPRFYAYIEERLKDNPMPARLLFLVALCAFVWRSSTHGEKLMLTHSNQVQLKTMEDLAKLIPQDVALDIWDPVGLLPYHASYLWYLGPGQAQENTHILDVIKKVKPDLIFETQRMEWIKEDLAKELDHYAQIANGIYLRSVKVDVSGSKVLTREFFYGQILRNFGSLIAPDWTFQLSAESAAGTPLPMSYIDNFNKKFPLTSAVKFEEFLYIQQVELSAESQWLEISASPTSGWSNLPPLENLFRFDAAL